MIAKEFLKQTIDIDKLITAKKEQVQNLYSQLYGTGIQLSFDKVSKSGYNDKIGTLVASLNALQDILVTDITRLLRLKYDITILIDRIADVGMRWVLVERYINTKDWKDVCLDNSMSWRTIHRLHAKGLVEIEKLMHVEKTI